MGASSLACVSAFEHRVVAETVASPSRDAVGASCIRARIVRVIQLHVLPDEIYLLSMDLTLLTNAAVDLRRYRAINLPFCWHFGRLWVRTRVNVLLQ